MAEYAPDSIKRLFDEVDAGFGGRAILAGIVGDSAHTYGYHRGRDYCSDPGDYSTQDPQDRRGDGQAACALDISWQRAEDHYTASRRLLDASKQRDPRLKALRSWYGSTDGVKVCGYDTRYWYPATSDDTHLWHIHASLTRETATSWDALAPIAEVITGKDVDDMTRDETMQLIAQAIEAYHAGGTRGPWNPNAYPEFIHAPDNGIADRLTDLEKVDHDGKISQAMQSLFWGGDHGPFTQDAYSWVKDADNGVGDRLGRLEDNG